MPRGDRSSYASGMLSRIIERQINAMVGPAVAAGAGALGGWWNQPRNTTYARPALPYVKPHRITKSARASSAPSKTTTVSRTRAGAGGYRRTVRVAKKAHKKGAKRLTFNQRVKKAVQADKEQPSGLFAITHATPADVALEGELPAFERITQSTLYRQLKETQMYCPTGVNLENNSATGFEDAWHLGGCVFFPSQMATRLTDAGDATDPEYLRLNTESLHFSGDSFDLKYLAVDWGWAQGSTYGRPYADVEVICGFIKDGKTFMDLMLAEAEGSDPVPAEEIINKALGLPKTIGGAVFQHSTLPARHIGSHHMSDADEDIMLDNKRFKKLLNVTYRKSYRHIPQVVADDDGGDGVSAVVSSERGKLFDETTYRFPIPASGLKQKRLMTIINDDGTEGTPEPLETFATHTPQFAKNIPFVMVRGTAPPDSATPARRRCLGATTALRETEAEKNLKWACQFKIKIADDE